MKATQIVLLSVLAGGPLAHVAAAQPVIFTVLNRASSDAVISPGCWISIFGENLAAAPANAPTGSLPTNLGGVTVTVGGQSSSLSYVSPTQIDALIPFSVSIANTVAPVAVTSPAGSASYNIRVTRDSPGVFTQDGTSLGQAIVYDAGFHPVDTVHPGDAIILYATGLGPVDASGRVVDTVDVYLGDRKAQVFFAGLAPGFPGVYQLNVIAPALATDRLYLRSGGWQSNITSIGIPSGANTANVQGTLTGLNPSSDPNYPKLPCVGGDNPDYVPCGSEGFSIMLHAATFSVSFDLVPSAKPFDVAAVGDAGGAIITIDPSAGTYTASVTTVPAPEAFGDFSSSGLSLWDYSSCNPATAVCVPFPGNIIPPSRLTPFWARSTQTLPSSNTTATGPNAVFKTSGPAGGSHFAIDAKNNTSVSGFGGIVQVPFGPFETRVSTFKLYVDGNLVNSRSLPWLPAYRCIQTGSVCWALPFGPI